MIMTVGFVADELETGFTPSQASPGSSSALMPDPEARSAASSELAESMLLAWFSSKELDILGVKVNVSLPSP